MSRWTYLPKEYKRNKEIRYSDVKTLRCFCFGCARDLGSIDYLETHGMYNLHVPLCNECWTKTGWKIKTPDLSGGYSK